MASNGSSANVSRQNHSSRSRFTSPGGPALQFSEVANYVSIQLKRQGPPRRQGLRKGAMTSTGSSWRVRGGLEDDDPDPRLDLPMVSLGDDSLSLLGPGAPALRSSRAQQLASQIDSLKVERSQKEDELKKMAKTASDSMLLERTAKKRAEASKEMIDIHKKRAAKLDQQINALQEEVGDENRLNNQLQSLTTSVDSSQFPQSAGGASSAAARRKPQYANDDFYDDFEDDEAFFYPHEMNWTPQEVADLQREIIREQLIEVEGAAKKAFRKLDLNGSGRISCMDFADGVARLGVPWQDLTGLKRPEQIFRLFDQNRDGVIDWPELFPDQANAEDTPKCPSTPRFLDMWFRKNPKTDFFHRPSKWSPATPEDELKVLLESQNRSKEATDKRKWMAASFKRLKNKGKTDARARECIASHLPRGSGPRDRDACATFSDAEVRLCKKSYQDSVLEPVKNIQKEVYEMREKRRDLTSFRLDLEKQTMEPYRRMKMEADRKEAAGALFPGLSLGKNSTDDQRDDE